MFISRPMTATLQAIPDGVEGVRETLKVMGRLVREGKKTLPVRNLAVELTRNLPPKDWGAEVRALHSFVRDKIRYVRDIRDVETVQTPEVTLELGSGDCDDKSVLLSALLESISHPSRFVAVAFRPDDYSHVLVETKIGTKWVPLETTMNVGVGWMPPNVVNRLVFWN